MKQEKRDNKIYYDDIADNDLVPNSIINEESIDISDVKLENKAFALQPLINQFEYRLRGYNITSNGDKLEFTGNVLMGVDSISRVLSLLQPFSREILLISDKKELKWAFQNFRTRGDLNKILFKNFDVPVSNISIIWRNFTNLMDNMCDIIINKNSQKMIDSYLGLGREERIDFQKDKNKGVMV